MIKIGTKIIGDFGGYTELYNGEVVTIQDFDIKSGYTHRQSLKEVKVNWSNGSHTWILLSKIDSAPSVNGSRIGYYTEEGYYA